ncbi:TerB family tellurite resistance protein [Pseudothioclava arenosa]|uniref:Co-chaperone DjlA N-terminal domain-containing protein n=1 Tax=Pseudothioclava arenosa TaxID=1795308 RepID=A0A2A4CVP8_9RHOB|nr:TerB family tellurite resistance protein [Pseudothioclava arenosa]PCD78144.1 hypothetical protein CLN94_02260 [Pseudothioclava arenosa]
MTDLKDFAPLEQVVADDLRFRLMLGIGEDAYRSLRYSKNLQKLFDAGGAATTGAGIAQSAVVAKTFFGGSSLLSLLPWAPAAMTPTGWVVAAGVASAGAFWGVMRLADGFGSSRVRTIPEFINTPIDLLGVTLVDMIGTLAVKIGEVDGRLARIERQHIINYFVDEWGIDRQYARKAIGLIAENEGKISLQEAAQVLGQFLRENEDCNAVEIRNDIMMILHEIVRADGSIDEREELALEKVEEILHEETNFSALRSTGEVAGSIYQGVTGSVSTVTSTISDAGASLADRIGSGLESLGRALRRKDDSGSGGA